MKGNTSIYVALITTAGVVVAAGVGGYFNRPAPPPPTGNPRSPALAAEPLPNAKAPALAVTGVVIGWSVPSEPVSAPATQFGMYDPIAVTVRYQGSPEVARFPVRVKVRVSAVMQAGGPELIHDVGKAGPGVHTFRLAPLGRPTWSPGQHLLSVDVDGEHVYQQIVDVI